MVRALVLSIVLSVVGFASAQYSGNSDAGSSSARTMYKIGSVVSDPFLFPTDANGKNTGAIIDILEAMKAESAGKFDYQLNAKEGRNGDSVNGTSTGLIKDLLDGTVDMTASDMTITATRHTAVDFLQPIVRSQLRIAVNNVNGDLGTTPTFYVLLSTSAIQFLRDSQNATLNNILKTAEASNNILPNDAAGIAKLRDSPGPAAFVGQSPSLSSVVKQNSDKLSLTSEVIVTRYYGFALPQNRNQDRLKLNLLLLAIQEKGILQGILNKYDLN